MSQYTVDIPPEVDERLKSAAATSGRSLEQEIARWLAAESERRDRAEHKLAALRTLRDKLNLPLVSHEELTASVRADRDSR